MKLSYSYLLLLASNLVSADIVKINIGQGSNTLSKRSFGDSYKESISGKYIFSGTVSFGTPEQELTMLFDTGSYTVNANIPDSEYCQNEGCIEYGTYDSSESSTAVNTTSPYTAAYADGASGSGFYFNDTFRIGGLTLNNFKFGTLIETNSDLNVAGLGLIPDDDVAPTITNGLIQNGYTSRKIFSTYYSSSSQSGAILFGGIDESKYTGTLEAVPVVSENLFCVRFSGVSTDCGYINQNGYNMALLDTGAAFGLGIGTPLYHQIHQRLGAKLADFNMDGNGEDSYYVMKCKSAAPLYFDFSGKKLEFSPKDYLLPLTVNGEAVRDDEGDDLCSTYIIITDESDITFGSIFLKGIYAVWDTDNSQVLLAQGRDSSEESLIEITDSVPNAVSASDYSTTYTKSDDTSYAALSSTSISLSSVSTDLAYTGTYVTGCTSSAAATSSSSSSARLATSSSSVESSSVQAQGTSSEESSLSSSSGLAVIHSTSYSTTSSGICASCVSSISSSESSKASSSTALTTYTTSYSTTSSGFCASCPASSSGDFSGDTTSSSSSSSSGDFSSVITSSSLTNDASSDYASSDDFSSSASYSEEVSTAYQVENSTIVKTIISCSDNICTPVLTTIAPSTTAIVPSSSIVSSTSVAVETSSGFAPSLESSPIESSVLEISTSAAPPLGTSSEEIFSSFSNSNDAPVSTVVPVTESSSSNEVQSSPSPTSPEVTEGKSSAYIAPKSSIAFSQSTTISPSSSSLDQQESSTPRSKESSSDSLTSQPQVQIQTQNLPSSSSSETSTSTIAIVSTYQGSAVSLNIPPLIKIVSFLF